MSLIRNWRVLSVGGLVLSMGIGCNHAQRQHQIDQSAHSEATIIHSAPVYASPPPTTVVPVVPSVPQALPPVAMTLPIESSSAKISPITPVNEDVVKRRSFADITADTRFSHAADYTWMIGRLHYVHGKDQWRLRFASVDEEDRLGGSVTLTGQGHRMTHFKDGQIVRVEGNLIDPDSRDVAPAFRMMDIQPAQ